MMAKIKSFFVRPAEVLPEFQRIAYHRNRISLLVICIMIFGMELSNMARVLFWSSAGLGTLNNRIYFGMYLSLFLAAAVSLVLGYVIDRSRLRVHLMAQYGSVLFFLLWHVCINAYDLMRNPEAEVGIYYTAVLGLSVFILMPARLACAMHVAAYVCFLGLAGRILSGGDRINITCTAIVALAVSLTNSYHHTTIISQQIEIRKMNEKLQQMAQRDALTGLLNKSAFQRCAEPHLHTPGVTLLMVDLDNFKAVNDQYGHPCGDFVLKELAWRIGAAFPDALGTGRAGGDEFVILAGAEDEAALAAAAQELIDSVGRITWHGKNVGTGCSIGACRIGPSGAAYDRLYSETDRALYQAKGQGKNQLHLVQLP